MVSFEKKADDHDCRSPSARESWIRISDDIDQLLFEHVDLDDRLASAASLAVHRRGVDPSVE